MPNPIADATRTAAAVAASYLDHAADTLHIPTLHEAALALDVTFGREHGSQSQ